MLFITHFICPTDSHSILLLVFANLSSVQPTYGCNSAMMGQNQTTNKCLITIQFSKVRLLRMIVFQCRKSFSTFFFCHSQHNSYRRQGTLLSLICIIKIFSITFLNLDEGSANISYKGQSSKYFGLVGQVLYVATTQSCHCMKAVTDNMSQMGRAVF